MARKKSTTADSAPTAAGGSKSAARSERDRTTARKIENLADGVVSAARKKGDPSLDIPIRSLSNVSFNAKRAILEMGDARQTRNLFNLNMAKKYMQTLLIASASKQLIDAGKTASIRQLYYMSKHTIKGSKSEKTFDEQAESDGIIEDLEVGIDALREELHVFADSRGAMVGEITLTDAGDTIDCTRMGTGGYGIPSIVEPDIIQFKKCTAKFILHVEKGTVWRRFVEDRFWEKHRCILIHGGGQPPRGVRRLLRRMHDELKLPVYCVLDNDPWGYYIYSVVKQGSINLAYESRRMAVPDAKFIGVSAFDYERCGLSDDVQIELDDQDRKRAKQILEYPWFVGKKPWEKEIGKMLKNGFKMEVEAMINKRLTYLTEEYVPMKLKDQKQWLD
ncbi:MAG: Type 2 DNA topoisomerase 6 subunit A [Phycisphaerae bacterium]|nr:Type 2 DNA topoisomerase 6 subunit A [Phycisphaerae bacterium]